MCLEWWHGTIVFYEQFENNGKPISQLVYANHFLRLFSHLGNLWESFMSHSPICVPFRILNNLFSHSIDLFKWVSKPFACLCSPFGKLNNLFSLSIALLEWASKPLVTCSITVCLTHLMGSHYCAFSHILTSSIFLIQFLIFSKDLSFVMSYTSMMPYIETTIQVNAILVNNILLQSLYTLTVIQTASFLFFFYLSVQFVFTREIKWYDNKSYVM